MRLFRWVPEHDKDDCLRKTRVLSVITMTSYPVQLPSCECYSDVRMSAASSLGFDFSQDVHTARTHTGILVEPTRGI